ncbi:MAG: hypothetical protein Q9209_005429 [Squamulea sp. 1 TL-2023]
MECFKRDIGHLCTKDEWLASRTTPGTQISSGLFANSLSVLSEQIWYVWQASLISTELLLAWGLMNKVYRLDLVAGFVDFSIVDSLATTHKGHTPILQTPEDIACWVDERRRRFPTRARKIEYDPESQAFRKRQEDTLRIERLLNRQNKKLERAARQRTQGAISKAKCKAERLPQRLNSIEGRLPILTTTIHKVVPIDQPVEKAAQMMHCEHCKEPAARESRSSHSKTCPEKKNVKNNLPTKGNSQDAAEEANKPARTSTNDKVEDAKSTPPLQWINSPQQTTQSRVPSRNKETSPPAVTPKKPKTLRTRTSRANKPDPTRQKKINHFTRRHKFVTEQSFGTYTTSQRRAFERDVYDYARALGLGRTRAKASVLTARTLCGEENYDSDDTRLDDDEMDDSSIILVSLPASTGMEASNSSFGRSLSATSPSIPWSGNHARAGSEILPSVEVRETPQSEGGKSVRNRKRAEDLTEQTMKRRKTNGGLPGRSYGDSSSDAGAGLKDGEGPGTESNGTEGDRARSEQPSMEDEQSAFGEPRVDSEMHEANGIMPSNDPKASKRKYKSQHSTSEGPSFPASDGNSHISAVEPGITQNKKTDPSSLTPSQQDEAEHVKPPGLILGRKRAEKQTVAVSDSHTGEPKVGTSPKRMPDEQKDTSPEVKKPQVDHLRDQPRARKQSIPGTSITLPTQPTNTADGTDKKDQDHGFDVRARELIRAQDAARRAREKNGKTEKVDDGGKDQRTKATGTGQEDLTVLQRKEQKRAKREEKKRKRQSDVSQQAVLSEGSSQREDATTQSVEATECTGHFGSPRFTTIGFGKETISKCPSTPIKRQTSSTTSSPLSSLPSTPPWPTPSRYDIKEENEEPLKPKKRKNRSNDTASDVTRAKVRKSSTKASPYFVPSPKPCREQISCIPFPPFASTSFGLVQESLAPNPFHLLIAVIFLNKTRGAVAMPVFYNFITRFPSPSVLAEADLPEVVGFFQNLGLQNQRAKKCIALAKAWLEHPPAKGRRWRRLHYPNLGDGKDIKSSEEPIADEVKDPRVAWEVGHFPGIGAYGIDSWRIFCRDELRGLGSAALPELPEDDDKESRKRTEDEELQREWTRVLPLDKELRAYLRWRWLRLGWAWDTKTGERRKAEAETVARAAGGGTIYEGDKGWSLENREKEEKVIQMGGLCGAEHGDRIGSPVKRE